MKSTVAMDASGGKDGPLYGRIGLGSIFHSTPKSYISVENPTAEYGNISLQNNTTTATISHAFSSKLHNRSKSQK